MLKQTLNHPNDIYSFDLKTKKLKQLTDINGELLAGLEMNTAEDFFLNQKAIKSMDCFSVHLSLIRPKNILCYF